MADPATYRPKEIPTDPGVYRYLDENGRVIYVGKAKNLRNRLNSYFADPASLHPRTQKMLNTAVKVEWTIVQSELESLQLEYTWIKQFNPQFNIMFRDDKTYPYLIVTWSDEFPRIFVGRGTKRKGWHYYGPYPQVWAIRESLDMLLQAFPVRSCSNGTFKNAHRSGRACLLGYIGKCSAPCVGKVSADQHRELLTDLMSVITGNSRPVQRKLESEMKQASAELEFEKAATLRDKLAALKSANEKTAVVLSDGTDADLIALAMDELEVAVQIFSVRHGRVQAERSWVADRADNSSEADLIETFMLQLYSDPGEGGAGIPKEVLVPTLPTGAAVMEELLSEQRGSKVTIRVPKRGEKKTLLETVAKNAEEALARHKTRRASDLTTRNQALEEIQTALGMEQAPLRIECYDISHIHGHQVVGSMVVFEDGLAKKSEYRRFIIKSFEGSNDLEALKEVLTRRLKRLLDDRALLAGERGLAGEQGQSGPALIDATTGVPQKFAYPPQLIVVDGGELQVDASQQVLDELGLAEITLVGLAKRLEEVWIPGEEYPLILPRTSEGLYLLQRIRDEAHRFAITFHRERRGKAMIDSVLDQVPGLGQVRRKALIRHFGSLKKLREASVEEISQVQGIGPVTAEAIKQVLDVEESPGGVNMTTGEVVD